MNCGLGTIQPQLAVIALAIAPLTLAAGAEAGDATDSIVRRAMEAEVDGKPALRQSLLFDALQQNPQHGVARWQLGHVQVGEQWWTVEELERKNRDAELVTTYSSLRDRHSGNLAGEISLARWCRKHGFGDRERLHWIRTLRLDSSNAEARRRLRLREFAVVC